MTRSSGIVLGLLILSVLLLKTPELYKPPLIDQANFELAARELNDGKVLYRDLWDVKPPLIFWVYRGIHKVLGSGHRNVVIVDMAFTVLLLVILIPLAARGLSPGALGRAGLFLGTLMGFPYFCGEISILQPETLENLLLAGILWVGVQRPSPKVFMVVLGLGMAMGAWAKVLPAAVVLAVAWPLIPSDGRPRILAGGFLVAAIAMGLWGFSMTRTGSLDAFFEALRYTRHYSGLKVTTWGTILPVIPILLPPLLLLGGLLLPAPTTRSEPRVLGALMAWLGAGILQILLQFKFWGYHYLVALPPLGLMAGEGLLRIETRIGEWWALRLRTAIFLWMVLACVDAHLDINVPTVEYMAGRLDRERFERNLFVTWRDISLSEIRTVVEVVEANSAPPDSVWVFGLVPQIHLMSGRKKYGRYLFHYYLYSDSTLSKGFGSLEDRRRRLLDRLEGNPPKIIVLPDEQSPQPDLFENTREFRSWPALVGLVETRYRALERGRFTVFVRIDLPEGVAGSAREE